MAKHANAPSVVRILISVSKYAELCAFHSQMLELLTKVEDSLFCCAENEEVHMEMLLKLREALHKNKALFENFSKMTQQLTYVRATQKIGVINRHATSQSVFAMKTADRKVLELSCECISWITPTLHR